MATGRGSPRAGSRRAAWRAPQVRMGPGPVDVAAGESGGLISGPGVGAFGGWDFWGPLCERAGGEEGEAREQRGTSLRLVRVRVTEWFCELFCLFHSLVMKRVRT